VHYWFTSSSAPASAKVARSWSGSCALVKRNFCTYETEVAQMEAAHMKVAYLSSVNCTIVKQNLHTFGAEVAHLWSWSCTVVKLKLHTWELQACEEEVAHLRSKICTLVELKLHMLSGAARSTKHYNVCTHALSHTHTHTLQTMAGCMRVRQGKPALPMGWRCQHGRHCAFWLPSYLKPCMQRWSIVFVHFLRLSRFGQNRIYAPCITMLPIIYYHITVRMVISLLRVL
jgi:hypothetical protein